jgi:hypothetical protein
LLKLNPFVISGLEKLTCTDLHELIYSMQTKRESCQQYMAFFRYLMNILNKALFGDYSVSSLFATIEKFTDLLIWNSKFSDQRHQNVFPKNHRRKYEFINHIANNYYRIYHIESPHLYLDNRYHGSGQCTKEAVPPPTLLPAYQQYADIQRSYRRT